jgi:ATP-dependent exoDNAse (exonuclease V) alpha subunit
MAFMAPLLTLLRLVPINPVEIQFSWKNHSCTRRQLPLALAFASTIHKAQGSTIPRAVIDIGPSDPPQSPGLAFVAISRIKQLVNAIFAPFAFDRLTNIQKSRLFQARVESHKNRVKNALSTKLRFHL